MEKTLEVSPEVIWVENHYQTSPEAHLRTRPSNFGGGGAGFNGDISSSSDDEEEEGHDLPTDGEWTLLPDGTKQIFNLYKGIADLFKASDKLVVRKCQTMTKKLLCRPTATTWPCIR